MLVEAMVARARGRKLSASPGTVPTTRCTSRSCRRPDSTDVDGDEWRFSSRPGELAHRGVGAGSSNSCETPSTGAFGSTTSTVCFRGRPYGVREGVAPVLLVAALIVHTDEVALYEHGTFRPVLSGDVVERLLRNPANFEIKHFATRNGSRGEFLRSGRRARDRDVVAIETRQLGSVLAVLSRLVVADERPAGAREANRLPREATRCVRSALLLATEPDDLLFRAIPEPSAETPLPARASTRRPTSVRSPRAFVRPCTELAGRLPGAPSEVRRSSRNFGTERRPTREPRCPARDLQGKVIDPRVARCSSLSPPTFQVRTSGPSTSP